MTEKPSQVSRFMKVCIALSISMLLVASGMFFLSQMLKTEVSSGGGTGPAGDEGLPDLSISPSDIWFSDPTPTEGDIIYILATVHNIGGSTAYNVTVEFWDDVCEGCPTFYLIGTDYVWEIPSNSSGNVSVLWNTSGQPGINIINVIVDPDNIILESDEGNNEASTVIIVEPLSDSTPPEIENVLVDGQPEASVVAGTLVLLTADIDDTQTGMTNILGANYTIGQANWASSTPMAALDGSFDEPYESVISTVDTAGWAVGSYQIWVYGCDWIPNCNTTGSFATINIILGDGSPDVTVIEPNGWEIWTGGSSHWIRWSMRDDNDTVLYVRILFTEDSGLSWLLIHEGIYPVGQNGHNWSLPQIDTHNALIRICATDSQNLTECDDSDDFFTIDSTKPVILSIYPIDGEIDVPLNATLEVVFSEAMNAASVRNAFFISPTVTGLAFHWNLGSTVLRITHNPFQPYHEYNWGFSCDALDVSSPGNQLDGCPQSFLFLTGGNNVSGIDLMMGEIGFDDHTPDPGQIVIIFAYVHNIGNEDAYNVTVRFIDWFEINQTVIGNVFVDHIPAGWLKNVSVVWTANPFGLHIIEVIADPDDVIPEVNEGNNANMVPIYVGDSQPKAPDLEIKTSWIYFSDDTPDEGQIIGIRAKVFNRGSAHAYNVTIQFTDRVGGMPPGLLIGRVTIPLIRVGYFENATVNWTATPSGGHEIVVEVDPEDVIEEENEWNNIASRWIFVGGVSGIDLTLSPSDIHFDDDTPDEGQMVITWAYIH
ncbi:MAG: Ig-like domain-containing protein, partial [Methanobacteriota archaeon]